jgi:hypothetical protein
MPVPSYNTEPAPAPEEPRVPPLHGGLEEGQIPLDGRHDAITALAHSRDDVLFLSAVAQGAE